MGNISKKVGKVNINVVAEIDGKEENMGSLEYRVMNTLIPPKFIGAKNDKIKKSILTS